MATYFNEYFNVSREAVDKYGAFNISLINDLPLFIDPFLLFHSQNPQYQKLHQDILRYVMFLRDRVVSGKINSDLKKAWFFFPEVRQNWLGFSKVGNGGTGLGKDFADSLIKNLKVLFSDFGSEQITKGSHIEKVCLVDDRVGRDNISDFTTNLIKHYLCEYTQEFARKNIARHLRKVVWVEKAVFDYQTTSWQRRQYELPWLEEDRDYVLLTP